MASFYQPAAIPPEIAIMLAALPPDESERVLRTFQFAAAAHAGQRRDEGTPYIEHPVRVAALLWSELGRRDPDLLVAALAHDMLEDCPDISERTLGDLIGERSLRMVVDITKAPAAPEAKAARDRAYLDRLLGLPIDSRVVKLADRIDNVRMIVRSPDLSKAARYLEVTRAEFLALAAATDITAERLLAQACDTLESHLDDSVG